MDIAPTCLKDGRRTYTFYLDDEVIDTFGPRIGAYGIAVYALLARHAKHSQCFPSYKRMQQQLGMSRQTVWRTLDLLEAEGLIHREQRTSAHGDPDTNLYTILDLSHLHEHQQSAGGSSSQEPPSSSQEPPSSSGELGVVPHRNWGSSSQEPKGISLKGSQRKELDPPPPPEGEAPATKRAGKIRTDYSPGFLQMWEVYPSSRRASKPTCYKIWHDKGLEKRTAEIVEKIERLKVTSWKNKEPTFIPMTSTWFNNGRWEDELQPILSAVKPELWGWAREMEERAANGAK